MPLEAEDSRPEADCSGQKTTRHYELDTRHSGTARRRGETKRSMEHRA